MLYLHVQACWRSGQPILFAFQHTASDKKVKSYWQEIRGGRKTKKLANVARERYAYP